MGGRLYPQGIGANGPWESRRLAYQTEETVALLLRPIIGEKKIRTPEELAEAVRQSSLPAVTVWIPESLEDAARVMWEGLKTESHEERR
jgi:hypothetical protein